jgi:hypothetical protein
MIPGESQVELADDLLDAYNEPLESPLKEDPRYSSFEAYYSCTPDRRAVARIWL